MATPIRATAWAAGCAGTDRPEIGTRSPVIVAATRCRLAARTADVIGAVPVTAQTGTGANHPQVTIGNWA